MRLSVLTILSLGVFTVPALAGEDCKCRGPNVEASEGETVCIVTSSGAQMARCERVLNNTSWTFLGTPCPSIKISEAAEDLPPDS